MKASKPWQKLQFSINYFSESFDVFFCVFVRERETDGDAQTLIDLIREKAAGKIKCPQWRDCNLCLSLILLMAAEVLDRWQKDKIRKQAFIISN